MMSIRKSSLPLIWRHLGPRECVSNVATGVGMYEITRSSDGGGKGPWTISTHQHGISYPSRCATDDEASPPLPTEKPS